MTSRSDATKRKLFDAAVDLVGERGVSNVSVDEIVERAGVAKGTVYYHFAGKDEFVEALIASAMEPLAASFKAAAARHADDPQAALDAIVTAELDFIVANLSLTKLMMTEMWREDRAWHQRVAAVHAELLGIIEQVVRAGQTSRAFRDDVEPSFAASALFGVTVTTALDSLVFEPRRDTATLAAEICAVTRHAVRPD